MKLGTETGSLMNHLMHGPAAQEPTVGMGATILHWTDRDAATVVEYDGKVLTVQEDTATRTDNLGMSDAQSYSYAPNPNGRKRTYKRNRKGQWVGCERNERGRWVLTPGAGLTLGTRQSFYDYSF